MSLRLLLLQGTYAGHPAGGRKFQAFQIRHLRIAPLHLITRFAAVEITYKAVAPAPVPATVSNQTLTAHAALVLQGS